MTAEPVLADTARWLVANPPEPCGTIERALQVPFDLPAEDAMIDARQRSVEGAPSCRGSCRSHYDDRYSPRYAQMPAARRAHSRGDRPADWSSP